MSDKVRSLFRKPSHDDQELGPRLLNQLLKELQENNRQLAGIKQSLDRLDDQSYLEKSLERLADSLDALSETIDRSDHSRYELLTEMKLLSQRLEKTSAPP